MGWVRSGVALHNTIFLCYLGCEYKSNYEQQRSSGWAISYVSIEHLQGANNNALEQIVESISGACLALLPKINTESAL